MALPSGYTQLAYISSSAAQYIDTGFKANQNTKASVTYQCDSTTGNLALLAADTTWRSAGFGVWGHAAEFGNAATSFNATTAKRTVTLDKGVLQFDGVTSTTLSGGTFTTADTLTIAALHRNGTIVENIAAKFYSVEIYDNGTLVRNFVPCTNGAGGVGMYDTVGEKFYTSATRTPFIAGPVVNDDRLEYIESSGTQYIDTEYMPNQNTRVVMKYQSVQSNGNQSAFGVRSDRSAKGFLYYYGSTYRQVMYGSNYVKVGTVDRTLTTVDFDGASLNVTVNGSGYSLRSETFQNTLSMYLFAFHEYDGSTNLIGSMRLYSCQIYDNGTLVRDYIPYRYNGEVGLWDGVSNTFYGNSGSGVFTAGPEIVDPDPPDPPEPPGPYEPPPFTEQTLAYLAALRHPFYKLCRLRFLQPDGSTAFSLDNNPKNRRSGAFIADGSISANLQNGKRRNATVTISNLDSSFDYNVNTAWFGTEIAIDEGLVLPDGSEYYIQQGVFAIENPTEAVEPTNRTVTYNLVDKWSYLDGTLFGNLESTYEVPVGTNIFQPIQAILALDRGNGQPVDGVTPIFTEYYNSKTQALPDGSTANLVDSPYTLRIDSDNGTYADVLLGLAAMVNAWIGYDQTGALRIDPSQDDILDTNKPILWQFSMDEATFLGANYTVRNVDVYNDYIVLGELLDDNSQPAGRATNLDPRSDTNVQTIGRKTFRMSAPGFATDKQCQDLAVWKLKRSTSLQKAITISCSQLFHIEENGLVTIVRTDKPGSPVERHLVMGFTRPLTSNGEMQIDAVSVQDFVTATVTSWPE